MTDKIIIDGIGVSECRYNYISITNDVCCYAESERAVNMEKCDRFPNCYYKQLKRKEQEIERYKEEVNRLNRTGYCCAYEKGCHEICKQQNCIIKNGYKYKQALDEIENIADDYNRVCKTSQYYRDGFEQIQDIINKIKES